MHWKRIELKIYYILSLFNSTIIIIIIIIIINVQVQAWTLIWNLNNGKI